jgi:hypothetical protein
MNPTAIMLIFEIPSQFKLSIRVAYRPVSSKLQQINASPKRNEHYEIALTENQGRPKTQYETHRNLQSQVQKPSEGYFKDITASR